MEDGEPEDVGVPKGYGGRSCSATQVTTKNGAVPSESRQGKPKSMTTASNPTSQGYWWTSPGVFRTFEACEVLAAAA